MDLGAVETRDATFAELRAAVVLLREQNAELVAAIESAVASVSEVFCAVCAADDGDKHKPWCDIGKLAAILSKVKGQ